MQEELKILVYISNCTVRSQRSADMWVKRECFYFTHGDGSDRETRVSNGSVGGGEGGRSRSEFCIILAKYGAGSSALSPLLVATEPSALLREGIKGSAEKPRSSLVMLPMLYYPQNVLNISSWCPLSPFFLYCPSLNLFRILLRLCFVLCFVSRRLWFF